MKLKFISLLLLSCQSWQLNAQTIPVQANDFKSLYNQHRTGQPARTPWVGSYFPYSYHGTAARIYRGSFISGDHPEASSPMQTYDKIFALNADAGAENWEKQNHTCDKIADSSLKESCKNWWGHCNGWAGAAIKEIEPRKAKVVRNIQMSIADQKGIFSELWLSSNALLEGSSHKGTKTGRWIFNDDAAAKSFWDVSPRSFFLLFTNYMGIHKMGLAIDRFTGDQVWNQPAVGYRILPIRPQDLADRGKTALIRMKFYWANDGGIQPGDVSEPFQIGQTTEAKTPKLNPIWISS